MKECRKCLQEFPATAEYFYRYKATKDGLQSYCKGCSIQVRKQWDLAHPRPKKPKETLPEGTKRCTSCGEVLPISLFAARKTTRDHLDSWCRPCHYRLNNERQKKRLRENPELVHQKNKIWRNGWSEEKRRAVNERKRVDNARRYWEHPERHRLYSERRLTRKRNLPDSFTIPDWNFAMQYFGGCCAVCGKPAGLWHSIVMDHWIPLSSPDCPGTIPTNIVPLCHGINGCNNRKGKRDPHKWLVEKFGTRQACKIEKRIRAFFQSTGQRDK